MKLVKILATAIWVFGVALASAAYADPPAIVGRLNYLTGPVSFAPGEAPDNWGAAQLNRPITAGDRLWTDNNGFAELRVGSIGVRGSATYSHIDGGETGRERSATSCSQ